MLARVRVVHTAAAVSVRLGVSEDPVQLMAEDLPDEDGCILVLDITGEDWTPAFTAQGIDAVRDLITSSARSTPRSR